MFCQLYMYMVIISIIFQLEIKIAYFLIIQKIYNFFYLYVKLDFFFIENG
jgi:hypothetical protein